MNATNTNSNQTNVGDIFVMSWGYDQTNLNWFQVTRASDKGVFVREIRPMSIPNSQGLMCENQVPVPDSFLSDSQWVGKKKEVGCFKDNSETFRKLKDGRYFSFNSRYFASRWDGKPKYCSWYA